MVVESQQWKCVEAVPAIAFSMDGLGAVRDREPARRGWVTVAEGTVGGVAEDHLSIGGDVSLTFALPAAISLAPLRGTRARLALHDEPVARGPRAQTLCMTAPDGRLLLVARFGPAGQTHGIGGATQLRAVLSQRPRGPMTFGTDKVQYVVHVGQHVRVVGPDGDLVVHVAARTAIDYVAYVIAARSLWISGQR
jgi:hypothetical protein